MILVGGRLCYRRIRRSNRKRRLSYIPSTGLAEKVARYSRHTTHGVTGFGGPICFELWQPL